MVHPYVDKAKPYIAKAQTGQQLADSRYKFVASYGPPKDDPVMDAARKNTKASDGPEEVFAGASARQISNTGTVRK